MTGQSPLKHQREITVINHSVIIIIIIIIITKFSYDGSTASYKASSPRRGASDYLPISLIFAFP